MNLVQIIGGKFACERAANEVRTCLRLPGIAQLIKKADKIAAYYEATQLAGFTLADAKQYFGHPGQLNATIPESVENIEPLDTAAAQAAYLARFAALGGESAATAAPARI